MSKFLTAVFVIAIGLVSPSPVLGKVPDINLSGIQEEDIEAEYSVFDYVHMEPSTQKWKMSSDGLIHIFKNGQFLYTTKRYGDGQSIEVDIPQNDGIILNVFNKVLFSLRDGELAVGKRFGVTRVDKKVFKEHPMSAHMLRDDGDMIITYRLLGEDVMISQTTETYTSDSPFPKRVEALLIVGGKVLERFVLTRTKKKRSTGLE